jgi:hypothetical protein
VLTFHVDSHHLAGLSKALDTVSERFGQNPHFRGLVCLEHDSVRHQILVISMWDTAGLEETQDESDLAQAQIAAAIDLGVNTTTYAVMRLVPGSLALDPGILTTIAS